MSKSLNSVSLTGYLGADPKHHVFDDGTQVANLRLAVARQKKQDGEWVDDTVWIDVKAFGAQAEAITTYLAKGSFIAVSGQLAQPRRWVDDEGVVHFAMVVDHAQVTFGPRVEQADSRPAPVSAAQPTQANPLLSEDDIPF